MALCVCPCYSYWQEAKREGDIPALKSVSVCVCVRVCLRARVCVCLCGGVREQLDRPKVEWRMEAGVAWGEEAVLRSLIRRTLCAVQAWCLPHLSMYLAIYHCVPIVWAGERRA